jgi:quinol monooxygenase YgiN
MYVVTVAFMVKPEAAEAFRPVMLENARASLADEPGCRQFDVCFAPDDPGTCFLYEVYDDRAAFDAHLAMAHFKRFDAEVAAMLDGKVVKILELAQGAALTSGDRA